MGNQSGVIFGYIAAAFLVYITLKGELPIYAGLLLLSPQTTGASSGGTNTGQAASIISAAIAAA